MYVYFSSEDTSAVVGTWDDFRVDLSTPLFLYNKKDAFECCLVELGITLKRNETAPVQLRNTILSVFCDLSEPSPIGGRMRPVLRRLHGRSMMRTGCVEFGMPLYVDTVGNRVDGFRVYIRQDDGEKLVSLSDVVTRGTIHVRARSSV